MAKTSRVYVTQLTGGRDGSVADTLIDEKAAADLLNVRWNQGGILTKRDGFQDFGSELTNPKVLGKLQKATPEILAIDGVTAKKLVSGVWTAITVSGGITFNASAEYYTMTQFGKDKTFIWNGTDPGTVYDGTNILRNGMMPSASFSVPYKGYHVASGVPGQEARVYWSTLADPADFTNLPTATVDGPDPDNATDVPGATVFTGTTPDVAQFVDISPSDGEPVTGLFAFQDFLIITKTRSIWTCTMDSATNKPVIQLVTRAAGCVSFNTGQAVKNDFYMLSDQGVITLGNERNYVSATLRHNLVSEKISDIMGSINQSVWKRATAVFWDNMYILSFPYGNSTVNDRMVAIDVRYGAWTVWDNLDARSWLIYTTASSKTELYFLSENQKYIRQVIPGFYYDNADAIVAYWRSKGIDAGALDVTKRWTYFTLFMRNIGYSAQVAIETEVETLDPVNIFEGSNSGIGFRTWGSGSWIGAISEVGGGDDTALSTNDEAWRTQPNVEARTFTFEVRNDQPGENFYLAGYSLAYISLKAYYFDQDNTF